LTAADASATARAFGFLAEQASDTGSHKHWQQHNHQNARRVSSPGLAQRQPAHRVITQGLMHEYWGAGRSRSNP
jgi:hypothetical protein